MNRCCLFQRGRWRGDEGSSRDASSTRLPTSLLLPSSPPRTNSPVPEVLTKWRPSFAFCLNHFSFFCIKRKPNALLTRYDPYSEVSPPEAREAPERKHAGLRSGQFFHPPSSPRCCDAMHTYLGTIPIANSGTYF